MISATIITLNEEENIKRALGSLDFVDEIVVLDSGSSDNTVKIAKEMGAKVYHRHFDNFANQKNAALAKTTYDWILSIDADEVISKDLATEIQTAIKDEKFQGFLIPRRNFILGKEIKHSRWSPDYHLWLWKRNLGKWQGKVHEEVIINGLVGKLKNAKLHFSHQSIGEFMEANNKYSDLEAEALSKDGIKFLFPMMVWQAFFEFTIRFFYKRGFLDGKEGLILSYIMGVYKLTVWIKLWEKNIKN